MRILILDDQEPVVTMLSRVCSFEGHEVLPFTSSAAALIHLATTPVDLLITDMQMPDPDGVTVVNEARRMQPGIFTLIITGHAAQYPLAELLAAGTADVMFKPFHMNELRARLLLTERRMRLIDLMRRQQEDLKEMSRSMISGLQEELGQARRVAPIRHDA
jgi:DNA-binding response OmpR family regulator